MGKKIKTTIITGYEKVWDKQTGELLEKYPIIEEIAHCLECGKEITDQSNQYCSSKCYIGIYKPKQR